MDNRNWATSLEEWRKRNRFRLQAVALILLSLTPFGLYLALVNGGMALTVLFFAVFVLAMLTTIWAG
jgi:hypothetical protein